MSAQILDGKLLARTIRRQIRAKSKEFSDRTGVFPKLVALLVGADPASAIYVRNKEKAAGWAGIRSEVVRLPADTPCADILALVDRWNADPTVHGILVQSPLPRREDEQAVFDRIDPRKDVDGFHAVNQGLLFQGRPQLVSCTPAGVMRLIEESGMDLSGKNAVVVGRSTIVGRPLGALLLNAHANVTWLHSRSGGTEVMAETIGRADVVVAAVGRPEVVRGAWIKPGAVVIDVGINRREDGKLVGDVEFDAAAERASAITPVPGGVGPMTIAMLMANTFRAAQLLHS